MSGWPPGPPIYHHLIYIKVLSPLIAKTNKKRCINHGAATGGGGWGEEPGAGCPQVDPRSPPARRGHRGHRCPTRKSLAPRLARQALLWARLSPRKLCRSARHCRDTVSAAQGSRSPGSGGPASPGRGPPGQGCRGGGPSVTELHWPLGPAGHSQDRPFHQDTDPLPGKH